MPAYNAGRGANLSGLASNTQVTLSGVPASIAIDVPTSGAVVTNTGSGSVDWALVTTANLSASPSSGTLAPSGSSAITLTGNLLSTQVLSVTNTSGGRSLGNPISIIVGNPTTPTLTLSGPSTATATVASSNFTVVAANLIAPITVVPTNVTGVATFSPSSVTPAPGDLTKLFTATWATAGSGKQIKAVYGSIESNTLSVDVAPAPPPPGEALILTLLEATPEHINARAVWAAGRTTGTTVRLQYKSTSTSTWTDGPWLSEFLRTEVLAVDTNAPGAGGTSSEPGLAVVDGFGGFVYHLPAGTAYDVRLAYTLPSSAVAYTTPQSYITRSLPATLPTVNKTCTTSTIASVIAGLVPGDHLQLQAGTYAPFTVGVSGSAGSPIYISCASGASVVYATPDKIITVNGSHIVFDSMTITGTGVDNEAAYLASGGSLAGVYSTAFYASSVATTKITVRNSTITGVDVGFKLWSESTQWLIYNNTISGNNSHAVQYTVPPGGSLPNAGWNDTCINWHGNGNCAFNNTISGFGDTVKFGFSTAPAGFECRANHFYRNKVLRGADDTVEFDNSVSGSCYRNWIANVSNLASFDGCYEGPFDVFENVCINPGYDTLKLKGGSVNAHAFHNTLIITNKNGTNHGLYTSNVTWHSRFRFQNNLIIYRGTGNAMHWSAPLDSGPLFDHNAWYSSTEDYFMSTPIYGSAGTLAEAKTVFAPRFAGDVATISNPFPVTITLGANAQTEYSGSFDVTLSGSTTPLNAGTAVPGINDGYTGAAPTMGAVWGGQRPFTPGASATGQPSWYSAITPGTWGVVTTTSLAASGQAWTGTVPGNGSYPNVVTAWGGGVINTDGVYVGSTWIPGSFLILHGGGHNDYGGNELYALGPFSATSPQWYRLRDPTIPAPQNVSRDGSGNPCSVHTYDTLAYISDGTRKWMLRFGDAAYYSVGGSLPGMSAYDFSVSSPNTNQPWVTAGSNLASIGPYTCVWDPSTNKVWGDEGNTSSFINVFDVASGVTTRVGSKFKSPQGEGDSALDTSRKIWASIYLSGSTRYLYFFDIRSTANNWYQPSLSGAGISILPGVGTPRLECPIVYDPIDDRFIIWADEGKTLYALTPPSSSPYEGGNPWTLTQIVPSTGSVPSAMSQSTNGADRFCYGRFNYVSFGTVRGYVLLNSVTGSTYFYRPASAT